MERNTSTIGGGGGASGEPLDASAIFGTEIDDNADAGGSGGNRGDGGSSGSVGNDAPYGYLANGKPRKRRPKSTGTGYAPAKVAAPVPNLDALTGLLLNVHAALSFVAREPALQLDKQEANILATASADLMMQYGGEISPKAMAWANFTVALGAVYGPRVAVIASKAAMKKEEKRKAFAAAQTARQQMAESYAPA